MTSGIRVVASLAFAVAASLFAPAAAHAGDSTWLWCDGVATLGAAKSDQQKMFFAASVVEGRSGAATRSVWITLVKGGHELHGELPEDGNGNAAGDIKLSTSDAKPAVVFAGRATLPQDFHAITLNGTIDMAFGVGAADKTPFAATLACKTLDDLAIGH